MDEKSIPQSNKTVRLEINLTEEQYEKLKNIKSLLSHKVPSQNTAEILEVLFDLYLNKNNIRKESKVQETSTTLATKHSHSESVITHELNVQNNSTLSGIENDSSDVPIPNSLISKNQSPPNSESVLTGCFMENGVQNKNNLNSTLTYDTNTSNTNPTPESNNITKTNEALKSHKSNKTNNNINKQSSFKRTRYIPLHTRRKAFQRANHCCEFTGPNQERCQSRYQLEIDHYIKPFSEGGDHSLDYLKLHCSHHNLYRASRLGIGIETIKAHY